MIAGCEPLSHRAGSRCGVVVVHGFTGCPASVAGVADSLIEAGFDVEVPRLPGHGTTVDELLTTTWHDWYGTVATTADVLAERCDQIVLVGQSMGATLCLAVALDRQANATPPIGLGCINPATQMRGPDIIEMIDDLVADGIEVVPGEGSDIADPDSFDITYPGTPLRPLLSFLHDGVAPIEHRFAELTMPLLLVTSRQDHVVDPSDSVYLAEHFGGPVEHVWLERSFHVATRDYERADVNMMMTEFTTRLAHSKGRDER